MVEDPERPEEGEGADGFGGGAGGEAAFLGGEGHGFAGAVAQDDRAAGCLVADLAADTDAGAWLLLDEFIDGGDGEVEEGRVGDAAEGADGVGAVDPELDLGLGAGGVGEADVHGGEADEGVGPAGGGLAFFEPDPADDGAVFDDEVEANVVVVDDLLVVDEGVDLHDALVEGGELADAAFGGDRSEGDVGGEDGDGDAVGVEAVRGDDAAFEADALSGADDGGVVTDDGDVAEGAVLIDPEVAPGGVDEGGDELDGEGVCLLAFGGVEGPELASLRDGAEGFLGGRVD